MRKEFLRISNGTKRNAETEQLHDFCLTAYEGEVTEIVGSRIHEMECLEALLSGREDFSSGTIFLRGERISTTGETRVLGKHLVPLADRNMLIEQLSIADNLFAIRKGCGPVFVKEKENRIYLERILEQFSLSIQPDQPILSLSQLQRYQLQLLKIYLTGAEAVLLDQRKMDLTNEEFFELYRLIHALKAKGVTFVALDYVLPREWSMVDTLTVVRKAMTVVEYDRSSSQRGKQQRAANRALSSVDAYEIRQTVDPAAPIALALEGLSTPKIASLDMTLRVGEIAVVFSTDHEVEQEFFRVLSGYQAPLGGRLCISGVPVRHEGHAARIEQGVLSAENWASDTYMFENLSAFDNYCLQKGLRVKRIWWHRRYRRVLREQLNRLLGHHAANRSIQELSPIEIQKLKFKSYQLAHPKVLLCLNPYSSVDIQMSMEVNQLLQELAETGIAVLLLSQYHSPVGIPGARGYILSEHGLQPINEK